MKTKNQTENQWHKVLLVLIIVSTEYTECPTSSESFGLEKAFSIAIANAVNAYLDRTAHSRCCAWSSDINVTGTVQDHLDGESNKGLPIRLWNVLQETRRGIPEEYLNKLQVSLPKRLQAVFKKKGGHAKY